MALRAFLGGHHCFLLLQTGFGGSSVKRRGVTNLTGPRFRAKGAPMTAGRRATTVAR